MKVDIRFFEDCIENDLRSYVSIEIFIGAAGIGWGWSSKESGLRHGRVKREHLNSLAKWHIAWGSSHKRAIWGIDVSLQENVQETSIIMSLD